MHRPPQSTEARVAHLEHDVRFLRRYAVVVSGILLIALGAAFREQAPTVLRARGIVIVDDAGRERILIGAPIPFARNRLRTDTLRVAKEWAPIFPDSAKYMGYYRNYRHTMHGMLVLDERGFDRVAVGDSTPDPHVGRRIAPATGIEINDERGFERTGYGLLRVGGTYRVVLGLDSRSGTEGAVLGLIDGDKVGLSIYGPKNRLMFFGSTPPDARLGLRDTLHGLLLSRGTDLAHVLTTDRKAP
jgi:hypothetical protein